MVRLARTLAMKPVAVIQHDKTQGAGFLLQCLQEADVDYRIIESNEGDSIPRSARDYSGIVLLGSNHSVNDKLTWIDDELALARQAIEADVPLLGHCFGAQLMSRAMGGTVSRNACPNIGWMRLNVVPTARELFGTSHLVAFNWHYDTFTIPPGASRTLYGSHCLNKGFALGKHLAFQCHFEITEDTLQAWCDESALELAQVSGPAVQRREAILGQLRAHLTLLQGPARRVYHRWAAGLKRPARVQLGCERSIQPAARPTYSAGPSWGRHPDVSARS